MRKVLLAILVIFLCSCGSSDRQTCEPGRQLECTCDGGAAGFQVCKQDGSGWDECVCECEKNCTGRECGPDFVCGESCGDCGAGELCNVDGDCIRGCTPFCDNRQCGPDPICSVSCGDCASDEVCTIEGQCISGCNPDCGDKTCGPDPVCQTSCGRCGENEDCSFDGNCFCTSLCGSMCEIISCVNDEIVCQLYQDPNKAIVVHYLQTLQTGREWAAKIVIDLDGISTVEGTRFDGSEFLNRVNLSRPGSIEQWPEYEGSYCLIESGGDEVDQEMSGVCEFSFVNGYFVKAVFSCVLEEVIP